ncbi:MAG: DNA repair protein RadC [Nitrospira sp.]|nr:DNA repair protein RadC [Nitrospira sp.]MDD9860521.1 DNA repair protein RadC [Nitrospira sp.]
MDKKASQGISGWPEEERPRERILAKGPSALSDAQLLAIVLRVGRRSKSAVQVGFDLLTQLNGLQGLANRSMQELCAVPGVGPAKAAQIKAAIELGKRVLSTPLTKGTVYTQSRMVYEHYAKRLRDLKKEECQVILLDAKRAVIRESTVSRGTLTSSLVHPREVFNEAVRESAAAMIFVHNHPSGDPRPSQEDRALTARLQAAGDILGVQVLDHIIIGDQRYVSFADEGWLSPSPTMTSTSRKAPRSL